MIKSIKIIDNYGKTLFVKDYQEKISSTTLDISSLRKGTYLMVIDDGESVESHVFVKE